ncbi:MAG: DUF4230 domain-containing protein [Bacteroidales bacterium]
MIFRFFIQNIRAVLDGLIVAALIVAFSLWDPFGWFSRTPKIKDTPVSLRSVKEIGQLVTAEYYGEVVASLKESMIRDFTDTAVENQANGLYRDLISSIMNLKLEDEEAQARWISFRSKVEFSNIERKFGSRFPVVTNDYLYFPMMAFLADTLSDTGLLPPSDDKEAMVLWHYFNRKTDLLQAMLPAATERTEILSGFRKHYLQYRTDSVHKEKIRKEIIYIGRGWVKAGIDFGSFDNTNFWFDHTSKTIYFKNFEPKILDTDINPWFIPEKKIKGYELVVATGRIKEPFEESKQVKMLCKEKLRLQALQSGILQQARENARVSLRHLFSLLMDEDINQVVFTSNKYVYVMNEVAADSLIDENEALMLDSLIRNDAQRRDTSWYLNFNIQLEELMDFCQQLQKVKFEPANESFDFYAPELANIFKDGILRPADFKILNRHNAVFNHRDCELDVKQKLLGFYSSLDPDYSEIYDFLKADSTATTYLHLDRDSLFSTNLRTQMLLSNTRKQQFKKLVTDSIGAILLRDPAYPLLLWYHGSRVWQEALWGFNLNVFQLADSIQFSGGGAAYLLPEGDSLQINNLLWEIQSKHLTAIRSNDTLYLSE